MVDNGSDNLVHQVVLAGETALTVYHDKSVKHKRNISNSMSPAFTVDDLDAERERVLAMDAHVIEGPTIRPWDARNMSYLDPDGNVVYFRSIIEKAPRIVLQGLNPGASAAYVVTHMSDHPQRGHCISRGWQMLTTWILIPSTTVTRHSLILRCLCV